MPSCGVRLFVGPSVRRVCVFVYSVKTNKHLPIFFKCRVPHDYSCSIPNFMDTFRRGPPNGASNASEVGKNRDSRPTSGFIACCQPRYYRQVLNTQLRVTALPCEIQKINNSNFLDVYNSVT